MVENKVFLLLAGNEDRDAAIIRLLQDRGAIPCFILKDPVFCIRMVEVEIARHGRIDGVIHTGPTDDYTRLVVSTVMPWLLRAGGIVLQLLAIDDKTDQAIAELTALLLSSPDAPLIRR
jgi:hypothetical protein